MSINRVIISGNLTRDCELRRTQSGMAIGTFGMAVNDRRKNNQTGEWEDYANFIDVTLFGSRAESLGQILRKGMKVIVEGKLRWSQWEKDGQKRSKVEVIVDDIELPPKPQNAQSAPNAGYQQQPINYTPQPQQGGYMPPQQQQGGYQQQPVQAQAAMPIDQSIYDDDIPF